MQSILGEQLAKIYRMIAPLSGLFLAGEHAYSARTGHENVSLLSYFSSFLNVRLTIVYYEQKKITLLFEHVPEFSEHLGL